MKKNRAWIAAFLSAVFPGLGQLYNRQWLKGGAIIAITIFLLGSVIGSLPEPAHLIQIAERGEAIEGLDVLILVLLGCLGVAIYSLVDAWRTGIKRS
jgi:drug/metabolite transporter (DMT)-like permease